MATFAAELAGTDAKVLEVAATIAYYARDTRLTWDSAVRRAAHMKHVPEDGPVAAEALALARRAAGMADGSPA